MFFRIMTVGDLHIGGIDNQFPDEKGLELQCKQLRQILNMALEEKCTDVVFTGDVFDVAHPPQVAIARLLEVLLAKKYKNLCLHFYPGNHDISRTTVAVGKEGKLRTKVTHSLVLMRDMVEKELVDTRQCAELNFYIKPGKAEGLPLYFLPYPHMKCEVNNVIVFAHNSVKGAKHDNGLVDEHSDAWDGKLAVERNQLWISGHLHTSQSQGRLHFIGVPADNRYLPHRDFFVGIIDWDTNEELSNNCLRKIKWEPEWRLTKVEIGCEEDEDFALNILRMPNSKIKVVLKNGYLRKQLGDDFLDNPNVIFDTPTRKTKKTIAKSEDRKQFDEEISNKDWIVENLPTEIKRSRQSRRVYRLIDEAEGLK